MIKRTLQHQIDTKAIRNILNHLDENWLVRNLEERDYGIDLTLERFSGEAATGDFILSQVKGTDAPFGKTVSLSGFPTKTIIYSQLFNIPFFVFYTSNKSGKTKFIWLQKYAEVKLPRTTPGWLSQESVTLCFPEDNDLSENKEKIIDIIEKDKSKKIGVKFLSLYEQLAFHSENIVLGQFAVGEYCHKVCQSLSMMTAFIKRYSNIQNGEKINVFNLGDCYRDIAENLAISSEESQFISEQLELLSEVKRSFLGDDDLDDFAVSIKAYSPY